MVVKSQIHDKIKHNAFFEVRCLEEVDVKKISQFNMKQFLNWIIREFKLIDKWMLVAVLFMQTIGLLMIYSITSITMYNNDGSEFAFVFKTFVGIVLGSGLLITMYLMPYRQYRLFGFLAILFNPLILLGTLVFGSGPGGVRSWINFGFLSVQPAEFVKVGMAFAVAFLIDTLIQRNQLEPKTLFSKNLLTSYIGVGLYLATCCVLILVQPDMGTMSIIFFIGVIMILCSGIKIKTICKAVGLVTPVLIVAAMALLKWKSYQLDRFVLWMDPFNHPKGHQNVMGYTAMALGGLTGVGVGQSTQKYGYVIEPHNDFIVTILAEEMGMLMVIFIMLVYLFMSFRCFHVAIKCKDAFRSLLMIGIGCMYLVQPVINLGGASGFIPLTGVTLPFISYGGTSTMVFFLATGIYLNVDKYVKEQSLEKENRVIPLEPQIKTS